MKAACDETEKGDYLKMPNSNVRRDSIIFYRSFYEAICNLPIAEQAKVYSAVFEYGLNGIEPQTDGMAKAIFTLIKPQIEANNARYLNGIKGGRPVKNAKRPQKKGENTQNAVNSEGKTQPQPQINREITKTEPNDNQKENANEAENDNDKENHLGREYESVFNCILRADMQTDCAEIIRRHIENTLKVGFYRDLFSSDLQFADRLKDLDEYADILSKADSPAKAEALLKLDADQSVKIFNGMRLNNVDNRYNYVWASVFNYAKSGG